MWSARRVHVTSRPTPHLKTRLRLESLDSRCTPSSLSDLSGDDGSGTMYLAAPPENAAPQIINFTGAEVVGGAWRFTGDVVDESPGGLTITFGGEPVSLQGETATTDGSGHFELSVLLHTDGSDNGLATARTVDNHGLASNVATYNVIAN